MPSRKSRSNAAVNIPVPLVTGAPGAGKSAIAEALLARRTETLVFDLDWLLAPVSDLVGRSIATASDLWPRYNGLWLEILHMIERNGRPVVLFCPLNRDDIAAIEPIPWLGGISWCLLDCNDAARIARLQERGWAGARIAEALADARVLRSQIDFAIDTSQTSPEQAAARVAEWIAAL